MAKQPKGSKHHLQTPNQEPFARRTQCSFICSQQREEEGGHIYRKQQYREGERQSASGRSRSNRRKREESRSDGTCFAGLCRNAALNMKTCVLMLTTNIHQPYIERKTQTGGACKHTATQTHTHTHPQWAKKTAA